jgi:hypothetical protein
MGDWGNKGGNEKIHRIIRKWKCKLPEQSKDCAKEECLQIWEHTLKKYQRYLK